MKKFSNLEDAIDHVIGSLSDSEKQLIINCDPAGIHLGLAGWVRSEIVSNENLNIVELIYDKIKNENTYYRENPDELHLIHPDNITGLIIDELIRRIK